MSFQQGVTAPTSSHPIPAYTSPGQGTSMEYTASFPLDLPAMNMTASGLTFVSQPQSFPHARQPVPAQFTFRQETPRLYTPAQSSQGYDPHCQQQQQSFDDDEGLPGPPFSQHSGQIAVTGGAHFFDGTATPGQVPASFYDTSRMTPMSAAPQLSAFTRQSMAFCLPEAQNHPAPLDSPYPTPYPTLYPTHYTDAMAMIEGTQPPVPMYPVHPRGTPSHGAASDIICQYPQLRFPQQFLSGVERVSVQSEVGPKRKYKGLKNSFSNQFRELYLETPSRDSHPDSFLSPKHETEWERMSTAMMRSNETFLEWPIRLTTNEQHEYTVVKIKCDDNDAAWAISSWLLDEEAPDRACKTALEDQGGFSTVFTKTSKGAFDGYTNRWKLQPDIIKRLKAAITTLTEENWKRYVAAQNEAFEKLKAGD
ncbi:hypothetical protein QFC22_005210 [Naganishia vaughanmartiniae]|uniref:Uncharacterized protein n=1 Tax=Naganishia vaughanmartiniae TaxID=1424756 RepID=A0ACC2WWN8_9TREE|nr:hypothetical protein QFC22_005210 [Naganishia vaughanmartiniae]